MATTTTRPPRELVHLFSRTVFNGTPTGPDYTIADFLVGLRNRMVAAARLASPKVRTDLRGSPTSNRISEYASGNSPRFKLDTATVEPHRASEDRLLEICRLDLIHEHIRGRLQRSSQLCSLDSQNDPSKEEMIRLYLADLTMLDNHRQQFARFFDAILEDQCRFELMSDAEINERVGAEVDARKLYWSSHQRQESVQLLKENIQTQAMTKLKRSVSLRLTYDAGFHLGSSIVTAQLCAREKGQIILLLKADLGEQIDRLVTSVTSILQKGAQNGVFGLVAWIDQRHCWFTYFTQWIQISEFTFDVGTSWGTLRGTKGNCGFEAHEVHLINAKHFLGLPGWMKLPPRVVKVVNALPVLLRPYVGAVDGTVVRERKIRSSLANIETNEQVEINLPRPKPDPAIVIGNIVLAGWSDSEAAHPLWRSLNHFRTRYERKRRILGSSLWV